MNRLVYKCTLCNILLLIGITQVKVLAGGVYYLGDANGDGKVNTADIVEIMNSLLGKPSNMFNADLADINGDGLIDIADIIDANVGDSRCLISCHNGKIQG